MSINRDLINRSSQLAVLPPNIGLTGIDSWSVVRQISPVDVKGNAAARKAAFVNSIKTHEHGYSRAAAAMGTHYLVIVDTSDALLVSDIQRVQDDRDVGSQLQARQYSSHQLCQTAACPWGAYPVLTQGLRYKAKRIEVKSGASLSLQMHHHRNEHWSVASGVSEVTNGERVFTLQANESTCISAEHKHRLTKPGQETLVMIGVPSGNYLGEHDTVRFEDHYGRTHTS